MLISWHDRAEQIASEGLRLRLDLARHAARTGQAHPCGVDNDASEDRARRSEGTQRVAGSLSDLATVADSKVSHGEGRHEPRRKQYFARDEKLGGDQQPERKAGDHRSPRLKDEDLGEDEEEQRNEPDKGEVRV